MSGTTLALALVGLVLGAELLARQPGLRRLGSALLVILLGALAGNLGFIPTRASTPIYGWIFAYLAPLSIFWLLLGVDLRSILRAGRPMLLAFLVGAVGTTLGVVAGTYLGGTRAAFGAEAAPLAGMFAGTYIGGSINFNAVALEYGLVSDGGLYAGAVAIDNILTAIWMMACLAAPRVLAPLWGRARKTPVLGKAAIELATEVPEPVGVFDLAAIGALGLGALVSKDLLVELLARAGLDVPGMLVLTTLALIAGQIPMIRRLRGAHALGMLSVQLFLGVIGALCELSALRGFEGALALAVLAVTTVAVHGLLVFGGARLLRLDVETATVASQANVGGGTTALALARTLGRPDLAVPGILVGSLGTALGTFVGFFVASTLGS